MDKLIKTLETIIAKSEDEFAVKTAKQTLTGLKVLLALEEIARFEEKTYSLRVKLNPGHGHVDTWQGFMETPLSKVIEVIAAKPDRFSSRIMLERYDRNYMLLEKRDVTDDEKALGRLLS